MKMLNTKISITPLSLSINQRLHKPASTIKLKFKRVIISTGYQQQKLECKKQFVLKNNFVDFSQYSHAATFSFVISKELQINNTMVDMLMFQVVRSQINMIAVAHIDLARFSTFDINGKPVYSEIKLPLDLSKDPQGYATVGVLLQKAQPILQPKRQLKNQSEQITSIRTESYNRQSIMIARRKNPDIPTAYQISRKNYKQMAVIRGNQQQASRSKSRRDSGSYKKRFEYQYNNNKSFAHPEDDEQQRPQIAPNRSQTRQQENSPMPRMKTPQPIAGFGLSSSSLKDMDHNKRLNKKESPKRDGSYSLRIMVDVYKSQNISDELSEQQDDQEYQESQNVINSFSREPHQLSDNRKNNASSGVSQFYPQTVAGRISQQKIASDKKNETNSGKAYIHKQHRLNNQNVNKIEAQKQQKEKQRTSIIPIQKQQQTQNNTVLNKQNKNEVQENIKQVRVQDKKQTIKTTNPLPNKPIKHSQSIQQNSEKQAINRNNRGQMIKSQQIAQYKKKPSNNQNKSSPQSENRYKMISDKLQLIQNKLKQAKKSQSPNSHSHSHSQSRQNDKSNNYQSIQFDDHVQQPRKPYSPMTTKDKQQEYKQNSKRDKDPSSVNTFKQQFQSQFEHEASPETDTRVNSFDHISRSSNKVDDHPALDSIAQETARYSDSNIKITPNIVESSKDWNKKQPKKSPVQTVQKPKFNKKNNNVHEENVKSQGNKSIYQSSVANFSVSEQEQQKKGDKPGNIKSDHQVNNRIKNYQKVDSNQPIYKKQSNIKKQQDASKLPEIMISKKIKNNTVSQQFKIQILPTLIPEIKNANSQSKSDQNTIIITKLQKQNETNRGIIQDQLRKIRGYEQRVTDLQNKIQHQEEQHRKQLMERELQWRNNIKSQQIKRSKSYQQQLSNLKQQNTQLKKREQQLLQKLQKLSSQDRQKSLKQSSSSQQEFNKLKEDNKKLRELVDKLNTELEQSDEKHFQALTAVEKKDLQFQRKYEALTKKNSQLSDKLEKKEQQFRQKIQKAISLPQPTTVPQASEPNKSNPSQSLKQISGTNAGKTYQQQYLAQKQKCVNLSAQVRAKSNEISFMKIKIDNLLQQKRDLQNQIDNIAHNNKLALAKQGSISRMNLQAASVTNSVRMENEANKEQINSLKQQVHELNQMMNMLISDKNINDELFTNRDSYQKDAINHLEKKYEVQQKKLQAYEQQIKEKKLKITQILNILFGHGDPKIIDQVTKIIGNS